MKSIADGSKALVALGGDPTQPQVEFDIESAAWQGWLSTTPSSIAARSGRQRWTRVCRSAMLDFIALRWEPGGRAVAYSELLTRR